MPAGLVTTLLHINLGLCELIRVEGTDWIVRVASTGVMCRVPSDKRHQFEVASLDQRFLSDLYREYGIGWEKLLTRLGLPVNVGIVKTMTLGQAKAFAAERAVRKARNGAQAPITDTIPPNSVSPPVHQAEGHRPTLSTSELDSSVSSTRHEPSPSPQTSCEGIPKSPQARNARRVIESLRIGLPSLDGSTRHLAVGFRETERLINWFLKDVDEEGGGAMTLKGAYGQGKTFALRLLEEMAREAGFITACTEIDATENRLSQPHNVYRGLMHSLRLPDVPDQGARCLAHKVHGFLQQKCSADAYQRKRWLEERLACFPLSWLLSDPRLPDRPHLIGLLEGDPNYPVQQARNRHACPANARMWPAFTAGTQGDFASFVFSGIGRLARLLGYKGLILIMDEMEKWYELNWAEQSRAGNLLGGLIWGATADEGHRGMNDHPTILSHSGRCGGYPFTTERRCHVGLAIAMTPRYLDEPDQIWSFYGPVLFGKIQSLTEELLFEYCRRIVPFFASAFGERLPREEELKFIAAEAVQIWKNHGELNTRSGVQAAIAAFDHWRDRV